jgi:ATP-dependent RNA helicase DeaD
MLRSLHAAEYLAPTPVQAGVIPRALEGVDVMAQARTGTGKTAAFAIPILEKIELNRKSAEPQALVLVPTRELAVQVRDEIVKLAAGRTVNVVALYGGKPIRKQTLDLQRGSDVIVGTPGRVLDHMGRGTLRLGSLRISVLDEADRMLDIGFRPDIERILRHCPASRQSLLLSATIAPPVKRLAERYMHDPESLDFSPTDITVETIEQQYFTVPPEQKFDLLVRLLERDDPAQVIVFCRTRRGTEKVGQRLAKKFESVGAIHGDLAQKVRDRVMAQFREGKIRRLVATDVMGRGIDVSGISHIINYDIPQFCDDYVHRVGRTGRMGREGMAYTFVTPEEGNELTRIEMRINQLLTRAELPGFTSLGPPARTAPSEASAAASAEEPAPPPKPKPVFGRPVRRIRRAL